MLTYQYWYTSMKCILGYFCIALKLKAFFFFFSVGGITWVGKTFLELSDHKLEHANFGFD